MRLVNSYLSGAEFSNGEIEKIKELIQSEYSEKIDVQSYKYNDRKNFEVDVDILDIQFSKNRIKEDILRLIKTHEKVLNQIEKDITIIIANDDTDSEILLFEQSHENIPKMIYVINKTTDMHQFH